jgi:hypothetical protein
MNWDGWVSGLGPNGGLIEDYCGLISIRGDAVGEKVNSRELERGIDEGRSKCIIKIGSTIGPNNTRDFSFSLTWQSANAKSRVRTEGGWTTRWLTGYWQRWRWPKHRPWSNICSR